jgi:hypothetical protein
MIGNPRLYQHTALTVPWAHDCRGAKQQGHRLLGGSKSSRKEFLVVIQERHGVGHGNSVEKRFGSHDDPVIQAFAAGGCSGDLSYRFAQQDRQLLGRSAHPQSKSLQVRARTCKTDARPGLPRAMGNESALFLSHQLIPGLGTSELAATAAGKHDSPAFAVENAENPSPTANSAHQRRTEQSGPAWLVIASIDDLNQWPPKSFLASGRHTYIRGRMQRSNAGHSRDQQARNPFSFSPFDRNVASVPGRVPFVCQCVVVLVDNNDRGEARDRGEHRGPCPEDDTTLEPTSPIVGIAVGADTSPSQPTGVFGSSLLIRSDHDGRSDPGCFADDLEPVRGGTAAHDSCTMAIEQHVQPGCRAGGNPRSTPR